jgi:molybdopterin synthase catalytic subunit
MQTRHHDHTHPQPAAANGTDPEQLTRQLRLLDAREERVAEGEAALAAERRKLAAAVAQVEAAHAGERRLAALLQAQRAELQAQRATLAQQRLQVEAAVALVNQKNASCADAAMADREEEDGELHYENGRRDLSGDREALDDEPTIPQLPAGQCLQGPDDEFWFVEVTPAPLVSARYTELVTDAGAGAIATFVGTTRDTFNGRRVLRLEYEAYAPMALAKLKVGCWLVGACCARCRGRCFFVDWVEFRCLLNPKPDLSLVDTPGKPTRPRPHTPTPPTTPPHPQKQDLCLQLRKRWGVSRVAAAHRVGTVEVCETSVVIAVSSPHRKAALEVRVDAGAGGI